MNSGSRRTRERTEPLDRYDRLADGSFLVDVGAARLGDLYGDFERLSAFPAKDLHPRLADYLVECAREIGPRPFALRVILGEMPGPETVSLVESGFHDFFVYLEVLERRQMGRKLLLAALFLVAGLGLLALAIAAHLRFGQSADIVRRVLSEGLTVAAWVALWEALATLIVEWWPRLGERRVLRRLTEAPVRVVSAASGPRAPTPS